MRVGVDEVGMGAVAGPVVLAAVAIKPGVVPRLRDSKLILEERRYYLADEIEKRAEFVHVAVRDAHQVDRHSIGWCWAEALRECKRAVDYYYQSIEVMADHCPYADKPVNHVPGVRFVKGGDDNVYEIQAAALVAKAWRDRWMIKAAEQYPGYKFQENKGYGTRDHWEGLKKLGPCVIHRKTWHKIGTSGDEMIFDRPVAQSRIDQVKDKLTHPKAGEWEVRFIQDMQRNINTGKELTRRQMFYLIKSCQKILKRTAP